MLFYCVIWYIGTFPLCVLIKEETKLLLLLVSELAL